MTTATLVKKAAHSRSLHGMLVPETKRGKGDEYVIQLVTPVGKEYRIVPDAKGRRLRSLVWRNVAVKGQVFEFASGTRLLKVEHYHGDDAILDLDSLDLQRDDDWAASARPEDVQADSTGIYA